MPHLKEQLYTLCDRYIRSHEEEITKIITEVREAANNETKSSAGDKYETGRETMQQEIDLNLTRLNELKKLKAVMERITPTQTGMATMPGSVVYTDRGNYYIAISAGLLKVDGIPYYAISAASPIGSILMGQKAGDSFTFNGKKYLIEKVA